MGPAALTVRYPFRAATPAVPSKMTEVIRAAGPSLATEADGPISSRIHHAAAVRLLGQDRAIPAATVEVFTGFLPVVIVRHRQGSLTGRAAAETPEDFTGSPPAVIARRGSLTGRAAGSSLQETAAAGTASLLAGGRTIPRRDAEMIAKAGPRWS